MRFSGNYVWERGRIRRFGGLFSSSLRPGAESLLILPEPSVEVHACYGVGMEPSRFRPYFPGVRVLLSEGLAA